MRQRLVSAGCMVAWTALFACLQTYVSLPPRGLAVSHLLQLLLIPGGALVSARPGVPTAWFAGFAAACLWFFFIAHGCHIEATSRALGWAHGHIVYLLPTLIVASVVVVSMLAGWYRQRHWGYGRLGLGR
jgi:hypothetical protein